MFESCLRNHKTCLPSKQVFQFMILDVKNKNQNLYVPTSTTKPSCARMTFGKMASASVFNSSSLS